MATGMATGVVDGPGAAGTADDAAAGGAVVGVAC